MDYHQIHALSTSVIAFVTVIGLMVGFYYNLRVTDTPLGYIIVFELLFILAVVLFTSWVKGVIIDEES